MHTTFDSPTAVEAAPDERTGLRLPQWLPLAGAVSGVLTFVASGVIGDFPEGDTSPAALAHWYATHHAGVTLGGWLSGIEAIFLGLFVAVLVHRCRATPLAAAIIAVGGAATLAHDEWSSASYSLLGHIGTEHGITPAALQAWQIAGSEFGAPSAMVVLLAGVAAASLRGSAIPAWLGVSALVLGLGQLLPNPWGFWALLLIAVWSVVAGVTLSLRHPR